MEEDPVQEPSKKPDNGHFIIKTSARINYNVTKMGLLIFFLTVNMIFILQKMVHSAWKETLYKSQVSNLIIDLS